MFSGDCSFSSITHTHAQKCKIANIKGPILTVTIPFLCWHVSSEDNKVVTDGFVFPSWAGSFPAAVTLSAAGLL